MKAGDIISHRVFIGVGHGGSDPGAVSGSYIEKNITLTMSLACKEELERHGVVVGISRTKDENDRLKEEIVECNAFNPDVSIEIHINSGGGNGFEIYIQNTSASKKLAQLVQDEVWKLGQNSRGIKYNSSLGWTREVKSVTVLAEAFFLDTPADRYDVEGQKKFGVAYAHALLRYLGIEVKEEDDLTQEQFDKMLQVALDNLRKKDTPKWAEEENVVNKAKEAGFTDGTAPQGLISRVEVMAMLVRMLSKE